MEERSNLVDTDVVSAISEMKKYEAVYQASLLMTANNSKMSLFNYLK